MAPVGMPSHARVRAVLVAGTAWMLSTCVLPDEPSDHTPRIAFQFSPDTLVVALRGTRSLPVSVTVDGQPAATATLEYVSEDSAIATVQGGTVSGVARGSGHIRVRLLTGSAGAELPDTVVPVRVVLDRLVLPRPADTLTAIGDTLRVFPGYLDAAGDRLSMAESSAVAPQLSLLSPGRAVQPSGSALVAVANGTDTVQVGADTSRMAMVVVVRQRAARVRGMPDTVRFIAIGQTRQLSDSALDRRNANIAAHTSSWATTNAGVATVSAGGLVTAVANGSAFVTTTVDGVTDSVGVVVLQTARRLVAGSGSGQAGTVGAPLAAPLVAQVADSLGVAAALAGVAVRFQVTAGGAKFTGQDTLTVLTDAQGRAGATPVLGTVAGVANTFTATGTGLTGAPGFTATPAAGPARQVTADSGSAQAAGAGTPLPRAFVAAVRDTFGNLVPGVQVVFKVTAGGGTFAGVDSVVATGDATGRARATLTLGPLIGVGVNTVVARTAAAPVQAGFTADGLVPVRSVVVTPAADTLAVSGSRQLAAVTRDSVGNVLSGRVVQWSSTLPAVATVSAAGNVTAVAAGDAGIVATSEGAADTSAVTVLGPVVVVVVTPPAVTVRSLDTTRLVAALSDAAGHPVTGVVAWTSLDTAIAVVSSTGLVTGRFDGTTGVVGSSGGRADTTLVTVTAIPVATVDVQPSSATLFSIGEQYQLTATARDATNAPIPTARFTWGSTDAAVATVSGTGLVSAAGPGSARILASSGAAADSMDLTVSATAFSCSGTGGTTHAANITTSQTWLKSGSPHRVTTSFDVASGAVLTIEPGALVCFSPNTRMDFRTGGRLVAVGLPALADHIVFTTATTGQTWSGMNFYDAPTDTSRIAYARVEYTNTVSVNAFSSTHPLVVDSTLFRQHLSYALGLWGAGTRATRVRVESSGLSASAQASVVIDGDASIDGMVILSSGSPGIYVKGPRVQLRNIRIIGSTGIGLDVNGVSGGVAAASNVTITGGRSYPLRAPVGALQPLAAIASDSLIGNARDTIVITGGTLNAALTLGAGLPYRVEGDVDVNAGGVLTVSPGARLAMASGVDFAFRNGGRLVSRGTAANPIVFTRLPSAATWGGLWFEGSPTDSSYITTTRFEYGTNPSSYNTSQFGMLASSGAHAVVLDTVTVRQGGGVGAWLLGTGARVSRTTIDTTASSSIVLGNGARMEASTVRYGYGLGLDIAGTGVRVNGVQVLNTREATPPLILASGGWAGVIITGSVAQFTGVGVHGGGAYPIALTPASLPLVLAQGVDSLRGNTRDTLVVFYAGSVRNANLTVSRNLPWRVAASVTFDSSTTVTVEAGAGVVSHAGVRLTFQEGSRLIARGGTGTDRILFTSAGSTSTWGGLLLAGRSGVFLGGIPRDTSYLTNVRVEYASQSSAASVESRGKHVVLIDSSVIRQSGSHAVNLGGAFSRIRRSVIDTAAGTGVTLGDTTFLDSVTIRRAATGLTLTGLIPDARRFTVQESQGTGVLVGGTGTVLQQATVTNPTGAGIVTQAGTTAALLGGSVTGAGSYGMDLRLGTVTQAGAFTVSGSASHPIYATASSYALLAPDSAARHRFTGNASDTAVVTGGTMRNANLVISAVHPMRFEGSMTFDSNTVVTVRPGVVFRMLTAQSFTFQGGSRLVARGSAAQKIQFVPANPANPWAHLSFAGTPPDSSYLTNVRLERGGSVAYTVSTAATHPVIMDSAVVRQSRVNGVQLNAPGSRFSRSTLDTTGRDNSGVLVVAGTGLELGAGTLAEGSVVRGAGGIGIDVNGVGVQLLNDSVLGSAGVGVDAAGGTLASMAGTRVTLGLSYPFRASVQTVPTLVNSMLLGNARDTLVITGGTLTNTTATVTPALPWRVESSISVDTNGVLAAGPGAALVMTGGITATRNGRIAARGSAGSPVVFTTSSPAATWSGVYLTGPLAAGDTSFMTHVVVERMAGTFPGGGLRAQHASHPFVIEDAVVRGSTSYAVVLNQPGSRLSRSLVENVGNATDAGVYLGPGSVMLSTTVRQAVGPGVWVDGTGAGVTGSRIVRSGGIGIRVTQPNIGISGTQVDSSGGIGVSISVAGVALTGTKILNSAGTGLDAGSNALGDVTGLRVTGGSSYGVRVPVSLVAAVPLDSLTGNARDSLVIVGGTLTNATATVTAAVPWRVETGFTVDTQAVLVVDPGAALAMGSGASIGFQRTGRLQARGMPGARVRFTALNPAQPWGGLRFAGPLAAGDTSYLTAADLDRMSGYAASGTSVGVWVPLGTAHPMVMDSVRLRQVTGQYGIALDGAGSRLSRSVLDTAGTSYGVQLYGGARMEQDTVRRSGGVGVHVYSGASTITNSVIEASVGVGADIDGANSQLVQSTVVGSGGIGVSVGAAGVSITGTRVANSGGIGIDAPFSLAALSGDTVTGSGSYPLRTTMQSMALLSAADQPQLLGNASDTISIIAGTVTNATATAGQGPVWLIGGSAVFSTGATFNVQPGARIATSGLDETITFQSGGRLNARGTATNRITFAVASGRSFGLTFTGTPSDTSFLTNAILHMPQGFSLNCPKIVNGSSTTHPVAIDSSSFKYSSCNAVELLGAGSRISRSVVDTSSAIGIVLGSGTKAEFVKVRGAGLRGISVGGQNVPISQCEVQGSGGDGIFLVNSGAGSGTNVTVTGCNLFGNTGVGLNNNSAAANVTATNNWWGDAAGPNGPSGDGVSAGVTFNPFALAVFVIGVPFP